MTNPYLLYSLPGSEIVVRREYTGGTSDRLRFGDALVKAWPGIGLSEAMPVCTTSTSYDYYTESLARLIASLKVTGGKTVICRQLTGTFHAFDVDVLCKCYFSKFPNHFRFLFYHPNTGYWMGATPELLLRVENPKTAYTRALAGTKRPGDVAAWDSKNIVEHKFVVDDILDRLKVRVPGVDAKAGEMEEYKYGELRHLCTSVVLRSEAEMPVDDIARAIHPTAAVAGYPLEKALGDIEKYERWPRNCYGGIIDVPTDGHRLIYVILRCVHFNGKNWAVYSGSGITADSDPHDEWLETEAKAKPLVDTLSQF